MNTRLEGVLDEMVTRAIDRVLAARMPEIEEAARRAVERGLERALSGHEGAPAASTSSVSAAARRPPAVARRPSQGGTRRSTSDGKRRSAEALAAAARAPANVVRIPVERRSPSQVETMMTSLLLQITETPGMTSEGLVDVLAQKGIQTSTRDLRLPITRLLGLRHIQVRGNKRFTRYYPAR
jgi:hypothetical protein